MTDNVFQRMSQKSEVRGCESVSKSAEASTSKVHFHKIPNDSRKSVFQSFCDRGPFYKFPSFAYVCSRHFRSEDYADHTNTRISSTAVPSRNSPLGSIRAKPILIGGTKRKLAGTEIDSLTGEMRRMSSSDQVQISQS